MLGGGARYTTGFEAADSRALHRLHLRAVDRRPRRRRHQGRRRQVPRRARGLRRLPGRRRLPRSGQRQRRHPRRRRSLPQRARRPRRRPGRGRLPRGQRRRPRRRRHPRPKDKCPDEPEDRDGFQDADGCPDPDNDKDGIPDKLDKCPNDPEDKDGFEDADGCPDPDNDNDGIPDVKDKCPNEPETFNGFEDEDGCPDKGSVIIQDNNIVILDKIKFKTARPRSCPSRTRSSTPWRRRSSHHPEFTLIEVAGHADERASDEYNLQAHAGPRELGRARPSSQRGIDKSRLRSKGYGEYCPLEDPGHNETAWEQNRRVEFKIVKTQGRPHRRRARLRQRHAARREARPGALEEGALTRDGAGVGRQLLDAHRAARASARVSPRGSGPRSAAARAPRSWPAERPARTGLPCPSFSAAAAASRSAREPCSSTPSSISAASSVSIRASAPSAAARASASADSRTMRASGSNACWK